MTRERVGVRAIPGSPGSTAGSQLADRLPSAIEQRVRQFIGENYYVDDALQMASAGSLIGAGVIDSTGVLELVEFLESEYGIAIAEEEVTPENLDTIERIASFISRKQQK